MRILSHKITDAVSRCFLDEPGRACGSSSYPGVEAHRPDCHGGSLAVCAADGPTEERPRSVLLRLSVAGGFPCVFPVSDLSRKRCLSSSECDGTGFRFLFFLFLPHTVSRARRLLSLRTFSYAASVKGSRASRASSTPLTQLAAENRSKAVHAHAAESGVAESANGSPGSCGNGASTGSSASQ